MRHGLPERGSQCRSARRALPRKDLFDGFYPNKILYLISYRSKAWDENM